jgi:hypothetical protein
MEQKLEIPFLPQRLPYYLTSHSVTELLPQESPENSSAPPVPDFTLPQGHIPVWETVPQAITQIPFFYPPPGIQAFQVAATLTLPNMVLEIPVWYLHPPAMVPQPSLPPQTEGIPCRFQYLLQPHHPHPHSLAPLLQLGAEGRRKSPPLHFPHEFNLLAHYARKMDTPPINAHLSPSYAI